MDWQFRENSVPRTGEFILNDDRRNRSLWLLSEGLERAVDPPREVVLGLYPTLDDLLAASLVEVHFQIGEISPEYHLLAKYAHLARRGLSPSRVAPDSTLEAFVAALLRKEADKPDFTDPTQASRLVSDWKEMLGYVLRQMKSGLDPFVDALFEGGADFAEERAFLLHDRTVYVQDVARGERWLVTIPGGPRNSSALILKKPRSLLFRDWSRQDTQAPTGDLYLFLGVDWSGEGDWSFSVPPVQRLSLRALHTRLQDRENQQAPDAPQWWDGAPYRHTMIAAPRGGSTNLSDKEVLNTVGAWLAARNTSGEDSQEGGSTAGDMLALENTVRKLQEQRIKMLEDSHALVQTSTRGVVEDVGNWVAHNLNNKLQAAYSISKVWMDREQACPPTHLRYILTSLEEAMEKVAAVKSEASSPQARHRERIPLEPLVRDSLALASRALEGVDVTLDVNSDLVLDGDRLQMTTCLTHLLNNAGEAILDRRKRDVELKGLVECRAIRNGTAVTIDISDNGCGVPDSITNFLFAERPFTTKGEGGCGLGLRVVEKILKEHHGGFSCHPGIDGGTTIRVTLPRSEL